MKKLHLSLDDLRVESFATHDEPATRGTVQAHDTLNPDYCSTGKYAGCDPGTDYTACGCGGISGNSCEGPSCAYYVETCDSDCEVSYMTNCHRCDYFSARTRCIDC